MRKIAPFFLGTLLIIAQNPLALAQSIWMNPRADRYIQIEILTPNYNGKDRFSFISSTSFLSARYALWHRSLKIRAAFELPFGHTGIEKPFFEYDPRDNKLIYASGTDNIFGNPYLGLEIGTPGNYNDKDGIAFGELGFRLPVIANSHAYVKRFATLSDIDRSEAFNDSVTTITGRFNYVDRAASGFGLRIRIGPTLFISSGADDDLYLDQAMMVTFEKSIVWAGGCIHGSHATHGAVGYMELPN